MGRRLRSPLDIRDRREDNTTMTSETTVHFLGRCSCGFALRTEEGSAQQVERYRDMSTPAIPYRMGAQHYVRCPEGHKPFKLYRVEGEFSEAFECDARCENAKGHTCKCSCGGMNHGKAYAISPTEIHYVENPDAAVAMAAYKQAVAQDPTVFGGRDIDEEDIAAEGRMLEAQEAVVRRGPTGEDLLGVVGDKLYAEGKVTFVKDINDATMYLFRATEGDTGKIGTVKWFAPSFVNERYEKGQVIQFRAKVKAHDDNQYGKATVVTYLEEMVPALPEVQS